MESNVSSKLKATQITASGTNASWSRNGRNGVIERLLETWLNKANERSFQIPFAHWLAYQGYTVLHVSRHCAMELGKDVIAIAPDGFLYWIA